MAAIDIESARERFLDPDLGFYKIDGFLDSDEVDRCRTECEDFIRNGPVFHARINSGTICDYVHQRSHDEIDRTWRIYHFLHNQRTPKTDDLYQSTLQVRDSFEAPWHSDPAYHSEAQSLQNYVIITRYTPNTGMLTKHKDYEGELKFPLLQYLILLSEPGVDYEGGEFVLYTKSNRKIRVQEELNLRKGDALIFDKSLYHEVEETLAAGDSQVGRWSVLIGARARKHSRLQMMSRRYLQRYSFMRFVNGARAKLHAVLR